MTLLSPTNLRDHLIDQARRKHPREHPHRHQIRQPTIRLRLPPPSSWHTTKLHQCHSNLTVLRLAAAVRPGGTLLIVGHHPSDLHTSMGRPNLPDMLYTAEQVAAVLDPDDWQIIVAAAPERQTADPDGRLITIRDTVLHAIRRR